MSDKARVGQITLRGREKLCAVIAYEHAFLLETLRYNIELREPSGVLSEVGRGSKSQYLALAKKLTEENSGDPSFKRYHDHYHEAHTDLIEFRRHHRKAKITVREENPKKVVGFMETLQGSLKSGKRTAAKTSKRSARKLKARARHAA